MYQRTNNRVFWYKQQPSKICHSKLMLCHRQPSNGFFCVDLRFFFSQGKKIKSRHNNSGDFTRTCANPSPPPQPPALSSANLPALSSVIPGFATTSSSAAVYRSTSALKTRRKTWRKHGWEIKRATIPWGHFIVSRKVKYLSVDFDKRACFACINSGCLRLITGRGGGGGFLERTPQKCCSSCTSEPVLQSSLAITGTVSSPSVAGSDGVEQAFSLGFNLSSWA